MQPCVMSEAGSDVESDFQFFDQTESSRRAEQFKAE